MHPAHRLARCALLLLAAAAPLAHAAKVDAQPGPYAAAMASDYVSRGIRESWGRPAPQAGLGARFAGGWKAAVNLTRAAGGSPDYDRYNTGNARFDGRPWGAGAGRRAIMLSLTRRF
jgi:hypothetical protein